MDREPHVAMHHMECGQVDFKTVHRNSPNSGVKTGYLAWHLQSFSVGQEFTGSDGKSRCDAPIVEKWRFDLGGGPGRVAARFGKFLPSN